MSVQLGDAGIADRERRRAAEHSVGEISTHAEDQWPDRVLIGSVDVDVKDAWKEANPIHYPSAKRGAVARFHRRTDTVLLARQGALVTVVPLLNRPLSERVYVRNQTNQ